MITLHFNNTTLQVQEDDSSYRYRAIMQKPQLFLKFSLPYYVEIPVGAWCEYQAEKYYLNAAPSIKKQSERNIEYSLTMGTDEDKMALYKMRNSVDKRLKFSMCAKPEEFIREIVANLNENERFGEGVWEVGECIDSIPKTVEFNHIYIDAALQSVADTFETEWEVLHDTDTGVHTINLRKVEYFKDSPLSLSYGKGNGFIPGVGRTTASDEQPIKRLYVQGGEENIDRSKYGSAELLLPKEQTISYDGQYFEDEDGFNAANARTYITDKDGYYIERSDKVSDAVKEDSLDCSEIYPMREGTVSEVKTVSEADNFYDFYDAEIPDSLNYKDCIIEGETPFIRFQTGMLAGEKDFEFIYHHETRRFEIVPQEIDGQVMPNTTFKPAVGDKYAVFGIMLPDPYICDNPTKTGASWEMFREAVKFLYDHEDQKFTFNGTLQGLWAKRNWDNVGGYLRMGAYIRFSDTQFAPEGTDIRITGIKDFISNPHSPEIELSNNVSGGQFASALRDIQNTEVVIEDTRKSILSFTKRRFRDAQETQKMLEEALLNFSGSINPIAVQTMSMLVGDESLQFRCCDMDENGNLVQSNDFHITYNKEGFANQLHVPATYLQHMTLGINTISSSHEQNTYMVWKMKEYASATQDGLSPDAEKKYYLYAKVKKLTKKEDGTYDIPEEQGEFLLSETAIELNSDASYYHLLVGILNSEYEGTRSFVTLYGYTEILPGQVITDVIRSADGQTYFDLVRGEIGGKITFLSRDGSDYIDANDVYDEANKVNGGANLYAGGDIDVTISSLGSATTTTKAEIIELGTAVAGKSYVASFQQANTSNTCIVTSVSTPYIAFVGNSMGVGSLQVRNIQSIHKWGETIKATVDCKIFAVVGISAINLSSYNYKVTTGYYHISKIMLQEGEKATGYIPYGSSWEESYLAKALQYYAMTGSTEVDGGLLSTGLILMKDPSSGEITAGLSGLLKNKSDVSDPTLLWGGGTYEQALARTVAVLLTKSGIGSKISCFNVVDENTVSVNGANGGKIIISSKNIAQVAPLQESYIINGTTYSLATSRESKEWNGSSEGVLYSYTKYVVGGRYRVQANDFEIKCEAQAETSDYYTAANIYADAQIDIENIYVRVRLGTTLLYSEKLHDGLNLHALDSTIQGTGGLETPDGFEPVDNTYKDETLQLSFDIEIDNISAGNLQVSLECDTIHMEVSTSGLPSGATSVAVASTSINCASSDNPISVYGLNKYTVIAQDGMQVTADAKHMFAIDNSGNTLKIKIAGLPTSSSSVASGELYTSSGSLYVKP